MKTCFNLIILLIISSNTLASSENLQIRSYTRTEFDAMFEIKVLEYPKIILDCQSYFNQLVIFNSTMDKKIFHLTFEQCQEAHEFLYFSQINKVPTCLSLNEKEMSIALSKKENDSCQ